MPRLFVGPKDVAYINDLTKELIKDVIGQKIYYYAVSILKTQVHPVYNEAVQKIFENPVALDVMAGQPAWTSKQDLFGREQTATLEILVQARDLLDKGLFLNEGDYFTYGIACYEVVSYLNLTNIFGQEEYDCAHKLVGKLARVGEFDPAQIFLPKEDKAGSFQDNDGIQKTFEQQRGLAEDSEGKPTGDVRQVRERLGEDMEAVALGEGPRKVAPVADGSTSTFSYDD